MEEITVGRNRHTKQRKERGKVADEAETWRTQRRMDAPEYGKGYGSTPERGFSRKRGGAGGFSLSPRRGGYGPLSVSPGQRPPGEFMDGFRKFPTPESRQGPEENWRDRTFVSDNHRKKAFFKEEGEQHAARLESTMEPANQETPSSTGSGGRRLRQRDRRRVQGEQDAPVIDESALSEEQLLALRQAESRIGREYVYRLEKRSRSSPNARYRCSLCELLLDSVPAAHKHIREKWHKKRVRERREELMLAEILPPTELQVGAVEVALEQEVLAVGLSEEDVKTRRHILSSMQEVIRATLPDCSLRLYGSSCTKFGFKDSDVNIDIQFPSHMHQPDVLLMVQDSLSNSSLYRDLQADFHARVPVLICQEKASGLICKVSAGNENAYLTTTYLSALVEQEPRLLPLVVSLRRWAQICHVDQPEEGGLPPYVLALMVIYFLQQRREPVLPAYLGTWIKEFSLSRLGDFRLTGLEAGSVLWEYCPAPEQATPPTERCFRQDKAPLLFPAERRTSVRVGQLWLEMLRFYSLEYHMAGHVISVRTDCLLTREARDWPKNRIAIEDPFSVKRNVAGTVNSQLMFSYILHCLKATYKYFGLPHPANHKPLSQRRANRGAEGVALCEEGPDDLGLGGLAVTSDDGGGAGRGSDCVIEEEVIEEEVIEETEESEDVDPTHLPYFPQEAEPESLSDSEGPAPERDSEDRPGNRPDEEEEEEEEEEDEEEGGGGVAFRQCLLDSLSPEEMFPLDTVSAEELLSEGEGPGDTPSSVGEEEPGPQPATPGSSAGENGRPENEGHAPGSLHYEFSKLAFTRGKSHTLVCSLCKRDGHLKRDCPEDFKRVELDSLPPMTPKFLKILNEVCVQCYSDFAPDELEERVREHILQDLEKHIRFQFEGAKLRLFGSSKNGFGFKQSDLDICMVLEGRESVEGLDCIAIIDSLARDLKKHPGLRNILPITTAKVPIVKFFHVRTGLEGDISLYNTLALHNTQLLASYAAIDPRVKQLCYVMKVFSKVCDIGDASRGSLSSYAYTLMVLYFLQQRDPPVIPVLQEIHDGDKKPEVMVDGWNVYFFNNLEDLPSRWPAYRTNTESVGQLWLGLLCFYTEEFDFREHVVCIRRRLPLTTFKKQWTSKYIAIEDPFDLNHNLGAGLSRRMTNFIMKAFINGRRVFGSPVKGFPPEYPSIMEYFFDPEVLTEGELAPNDRCCRICGKIGHFMKDCPLRRKVRPRRGQEDGRWQGEQEPQDHALQQTDRRRQEDWDTRERRCFLCGSHAHIKKECPQQRNPTGTPFSPSAPSHLKNHRDKRGSPQQEEKKQVILSPAAGSLVSRNMTQGRTWQKKSSQH
ncbi:terminal uridylyltransferase 7 [Conger conger]|uniref:terminal uridylyltransferase 7 n=1 Tax=Conger conger TaxID=82655 RepID=UPI002A5A1695|nr:terminal uridylyltransferase 7 [Conger conger]